MEALSAGRPVVGYDTAGLADLVARGWVRGVVPGAAPAVVASELVQAMSRPAGIPGAELPTWDSCAADLEQVYRRSVRQ
jgi:glycosyltransferase involved in cell wall biosynthesis